jgi:hypothetical protein
MFKFQKAADAACRYPVDDIGDLFGNLILDLINRVRSKSLGPP